MLQMIFKSQYQAQRRAQDPRIKKFLETQRKVDKSAVSLAAHHLDESGRTIFTNQYMEKYKVSRQTGNNNDSHAN